MPTSPQLTIRLVLGEFEQLIIVAGEVGAVNAGDLKRFLNRVFECSDGDLVIDLADVRYLDSTGLSVLLEVRDTLIAAERQLALRNPSPEVLLLLDVCGLVEHLPIFIGAQPVGGVAAANVVSALAEPATAVATPDSDDAIPIDSD